MWLVGDDGKRRCFQRGSAVEGEKVEEGEEGVKCGRVAVLGEGVDGEILFVFGC